MAEGAGSHERDEAWKHILDAVDIETFIVSKDEAEARELVYRIFGSAGFGDLDIVYLEHRGLGARVRARAYVHRPGDRYGWLEAAAGAAGRGSRIPGGSDG